MAVETTVTPAALQVFQLPSGIALAATMVRKILPAVREDLNRWRGVATRCPDPVLRTQALASIEAKRFHCQGGAALALTAGPRWREAVGFIVALQTISDYLDNLCDRAGQYDVAVLRQLHLAMVDAVGGDGGQRSYYTLYPHAADGGYLAALVDECRHFVRGWAVPAAITGTGARLASLYGEMQARKHGPPHGRVEGLEDWFREYVRHSTGEVGSAQHGGLLPALPVAGGLDLLWNEFGAACGSTLGIFALYSSAAAATAGGSRNDSPMDQPQGVTAGGHALGEGTLGGVRNLLGAYFPWICGLHILLDYLIDRHEDETTGDLNFTAHYVSYDQLRERMLWFVRQASGAAAGLPEGRFHKSLVDGLLGVYLSDPKACRNRSECLVRDLLRAAGPGARAMHAVCLGLRWTGAV